MGIVHIKIKYVTTIWEVYIDLSLYAKVWQNVFYPLHAKILLNNM
jgi:hypothetical protein